MECPYCKEEIKEGSKKCKFCSEILGTKGKINTVIKVTSGFISILIPILTTTLALYQYQEKVRVTEEKNIVESAKKATDEVLEAIVKQTPPNTISAIAEEDLSPSDPQIKTGYDYLKNNEPAEAKTIFENSLKDDPENIAVQKGLIYSDILLEKK